MSLFTATGAEAVTNATKADVDFQKVYIRLKDGESVKVRLLGLTDFVEYKAHAGGFNLGVYTQPCIAPTGQACPLCVAQQHGDEDMAKALRVSSRYLVAMADIETGDLRVWDCSKKQLKTFISQLEEYKEMIEDGEELAFTFKRAGNKTDTTYTLSPIMRLNPALKEGYHAFDGQTVELEFFGSVLLPRSEQSMVKTLKETGFNVAKHFPHINLTDDADSVEPIADVEADALDII